MLNLLPADMEVLHFRVSSLHVKREPVLLKLASLELLQRYPDAPESLQSVI